MKLKKKKKKKKKIEKKGTTWVENLIDISLNDKFKNGHTFLSHWLHKNG